TMNAVRFVALLALLIGVSAATAAAPPAIDPGDPLPPGAVLRLGSARLRHPVGIDSLVLSADGRTIASADKYGHVRLWDAGCGRLLLTMPWDTAECVALSPDGRTLATAGRERCVRLWDVRTGKQIRVIRELVGNWVAFSPDGKTLAGFDVEKRFAFCEA